MPLTRGEVESLEADADRAWPARQTITGDGWSARWADGMHRRINSATIGPDADLVSAVRAIGSFYEQRGYPPTVKITGEASHPDIDAYLAKIGYRRDALTQVRAGDTLTAVADRRVEIGADRDSWLAAFAEIAKYDSHAAVLLGEIIDRMSEAWFAVVTDRGIVRSVGLGVPVPPRLGIFAMATRPDDRGRGHASAVLNTLMERAAARGMGEAFLQVLDDNDTATRLYGKLGLDLRYRYWYRVGVTPGPR